MCWYWGGEGGGLGGGNINGGPPLFTDIMSTIKNDALWDIFELIDQDIEFPNNNSMLLSGRAEAISNGDINFEEIYKNDGVKPTSFCNCARIIKCTLVIANGIIA